jgi:hypothetical protein
MKMKKRTLIISLIIFLVLIIAASFWYWYYFVKEKYLTNIEELYSLFTDYMKETVDSRLRVLDCTPKEYYYNNFSFCFVCKKIHPCFNFVWVDREGGKKMNPYGVYLRGKYDTETDLNFYTFGIAKVLNCKCNQECICENGIKLRMESVGFIPKWVRVQKLRHV